MAVKALRKIQLGRETTAGTAVAATAIWRGMGTLEDNRQVVFVEEDVGILTGTDRTYIPKYEGAIAMEAVPATFEQLPHILESAIKSIQTGVADTGSGTGKIYDYTLPETSANTIAYNTIEAGDDLAVEELEYAFVSDMTLDGKAAEAWTMSANWIGRQISTSSFSTTATLPTVEEILFGKTALYIDTAGGSYGGTIKSNTLLAASLKIKTGWIPVYTGGSALYFAFAKATAPEITLDITFEHDATSVAEKAAAVAQTPRLIQLKALGSALQTTGAYGYKTMIINLAGRWEKFSKIGEQDGNDIVTGTFRARYNATKADIGNIIVVNTVASVP